MKFMFYFLLGAFAFFVSGCTPAYNSINTINIENQAKMTSSEKSELFKIALKEAYDTNPMPKTFIYSGTSIVFQDVTASGNMRYYTYWENRLVINGNTIKVEKVRSESCVFCPGSEKDFTRYTNELSASTAEKYNKLLVEYLEFFSKFPELKNKIDSYSSAQREKIKVSVIDTTGLLPSNVLNNLNKVSITRTYEDQNSDRLAMFLAYKNNNNYYINNIKFDLIPQGETKSRYAASYNKGGIRINNEQIGQGEHFFKITNVYFNYVPETFSVKNENLELEFNYRDSVKIHNISKEAITITNISGYYGPENSKITSSLLKNEVKILPLTHLTLGLVSPGNSNSIEVKNINTEIIYGYFIEYTVNGVKKSIPIEKSVKKLKISNYY